MRWPKRRRTRWPAIHSSRRRCCCCGCSLQERNSNKNSMARRAIWLTWMLLVAAAAPTTAPIDQSTPKGALKFFAKSLDTGDRKSILEVLAADNEKDRKVAAATADL